MVKYHVGVDVGKRRHHVSIQDVASGTCRKTFAIGNDRDGFAELLSSLERISTDKAEFLVGVEACGYGLNLVYFLMAVGFSLVEVNPFRAGQFRKAQGSKAKTDQIDARAIAAILSLGNHKPLSIPDPILDNLKDLTRFRTDLVGEKATMLIHLQEALSILFPEFERVIRKLDSAASLAVLAAFPGPERLIEAGEIKVGRVLSAASPRHMSLGMARRLMAAARDSVGVVQKQPALGVKISILAKRIASLQATILEIDARIADLYDSLPNKPTGFPVGRTSSVAAMVSEIGDVRRFGTVGKFLSHLGWCPKTFQTGGYRMEHPRMSHAGNRYVRRLVWMLSVVAVRIVPRYREYYKRRVSEGKAKMHILVAIGRKLLSLLYALLKTGARYDPNWEGNGRLALARH